MRSTGGDDYSRQWFKIEMKARLIIGVVLMVAALAAYVFFQRTRHVDGTPNDLGQQLVIAAEHEQWSWARTLLESGADPTVTLLDSKHEDMLAQRGWLDWLFPSVHYVSGHATVLPTALRQAMEQGNPSAVQMLLDHHVPVSGEDVVHARDSGNRQVIQIMEAFGQVPLRRRSISQAPFSPGAQSAREQAISNTTDAVPTRHLPWLSDHELLLLHEQPRRFSILNIRSASQTDLPALSQKWADDQLFDRDMFAVSPDGRWLLGYGGTPDHPTWLATEIQGEGRQEWDRDPNPDPAFASAREGQGAPMIAWRDNSRWVEIPVTPPTRSVVRLRALGSPDVQQLPLDRSKYSFVLGYPYVLFTFAQPDAGLICGQVGSTGNNTHFIAFMAKVVAGADSWRMEDGGEIWMEEAATPGFFHRVALSPDRKRIAWLAWFNDSNASDILLSDADGSHFRIIYERLAPPHLWEQTRKEAPWFRSLEWTPDGNSLIFWRGGKGENGLGTLPVYLGE